MGFCCFVVVVAAVVAVVVDVVVVDVVVVVFVVVVFVIGACIVWLFDCKLFYSSDGGEAWDEAGGE